MQIKTEYSPGACNIGPAEIRLRWISALIGLTLTIGLWLIFWLSNTPPATRLVLFFPAAITGGGILQAAGRFCVNFGLRGVFNLNNTPGQTNSVEQAEYRRLDRRRALGILAGSTIIGLVVAVVSYLV